MTRELKTAMIMAAGYGTRMGELTAEIPKPLLPLNENRIIEVLLLKLAASGITKAVINLHYKPEVVRQLLCRDYGLEIVFSEEAELLGSGGGIANAEKHFTGEDILVVNADTLCEIDIRDFYRWHLRSAKQATMAVLPSQNNIDYGLVSYDDSHQLRRFNLRGQDIPDDFNNAIFIGYQVLTPSARKLLKPENQSVITALYKQLMTDMEVGVYCFRGSWIDIGTKDFYDEFVKKIQCGSISLDNFLR